MSYYQGDFYRGDPGFFGTLGRIFKGVAGTAAGFIPGVGGIVGKAIAKIPGGAGTIKAVGGAIIKHPVLSAAGAAGVIGAAGAGAGAMAARRSSSKALSMHVGPGGVLMHRKRRRMNPCNGKALRRAIRRAHAFERMAKHVIGFSSPRKPKGHMYFKRKRKK